MLHDNNKYPKQNKKHNYKQSSNFSKYIKLIDSFNKDPFTWKKKNPFQEKKDQNDIHMFSYPKGILAFLQSKEGLIKQKKQLYNKNDEKADRITIRSKSTDIQHSKFSQKISLPSLKNHISYPSKRQSYSHNRSNTQPSSLSTIKLPKLFFHQSQGVRSGNLFDYVKMKPTQRHFSKLQNVRLAQNLLLMEPSKIVSKSEHKKFWQEQKTYRNKISRSILMKKNSQVKFKNHRYKQSKSQWIQ